MNRENLAQIKTYALGIAALLYSDFSEVCSEDFRPHYKPQWEPSNDWYSAMTRELLTVCQATEEMSHPEGKERSHDLELPRACQATEEMSHPEGALP